MKYNIVYQSEYDNKHYPKIVANTNVLHPLEISWHHENKTLTLLSSKEDYIGNAYLSDAFILIRYAKNSNSPQFANNLIVYNLEKKIIQIIPPPKPKNWINSDLIYSLGEKKIFGGKEYITVSIFKSDETDSSSGQEEIHYLNLENFEYHTLYFESYHDYGR